jgi:hypothetical protein
MYGDMPDIASYVKSGSVEIGRKASRLCRLREPQEGRMNFSRRALRRR